MSDVLERAKEVQRNTATATALWVKLALLEDLIAEIERLRAIIADAPVTQIDPRLDSPAAVRRALQTLTGERSRPEGE